MKKLFSLVLACLLLVGLFAGCKKAEDAPDATGGSKKPVEITWIIRTAEPKHYQEVMKAVNEKLSKELNMTLNLKCIAPGDYNDKMQMAMAGGDKWDLCFTAHWANNYVNAVGKEAYLELTMDMLKKNCPDVMKTIPEGLWDGIKVGGKIYGLLNYQVMYDQPGLWFNKDAMDKANLKPEDVKDWDSMNAILEKLHAAYPEKYPMRGGGPFNPDQFFQEEPLCTIMSYPWLYFNTATKKIENNTYFDKISGFLTSTKLWKDKGWTPADAATLKDENTLITGGQILSRYSRQKPGNAADLFNQFGIEFYSVPTGPAVINTTSAQSTITAVNANSEHPNEAMQMFNYVFSHKDVANMLFYGLEGLDYKLVNGRVERNKDAWNVPQWQLGNQFNAILTTNAAEGVWEETMKGNAEAKLDALFGFVPDRTPFETELATCEALWNEYKDILYYGLRDYKEAVPEMLDKMQKAGLEKVTTELQKQVDAFLAAK